MDVLIRRKRHLSRIEANRQAAFIGEQGAAVGAHVYGGILTQVDLRVGAGQGGVLDVGVTKRRHFVPCLERVGERTVPVVHVIGVTHSERPSRRGGSGDGLVHSLDPPGVLAALDQIVIKSEGGVGDFTVFPRFVLHRTVFILNRDDVPRGTCDRVP